MRRFATLVSTFALVISVLTTSPASAAIGDIPCGESGTFQVSGTIVTASNNCKGEARIPEYVTRIENDAFYQAGLLTKVTFLGNNVAEIGDYAFAAASQLSEIAIPESVDSIGLRAFLTTPKLSSIYIPANVTAIGDFAFYNSGIKQLNVASDNPNYSSQSNILFNKNKDQLIRYPVDASTEYTIPENVLFISPAAFADTSLTSIRFALNSSISIIGIRAFAYASNLTVVDIPGSVTAVGEGAFTGADSLTNITIPASVTEIDFSAFQYAASLKKFYFLGNAPVITGPSPLLVLQESFAYVKVGALGFQGGFGDTWNGLTLKKGRVVTFSENGATSGTVPNVMMRGVGEAVTAPGNTGLLLKAGYTFEAWNTEASGNGITFTSGSSDLMPDEDFMVYAKWVAVPAVIPPIDVAAQAAAADLATRTISAKKKFAIKPLAKQVGVTIVSPKAKVTFKVAGASKKICTKSGSKLKTLKAGNCIVTFTVQEPKPKKGKKPKATKTVKTFVIQ